MELNSKKLERTSRIVYNAISGILCLFLILLSDNIISDLDTVTVCPEIETFENTGLSSQLNKKSAVLNTAAANLNAKKQVIEKTIAAAKQNYTNEKQSFDNWIQARKTLGSPNKDQEVISRAEKLDEFYKIEQNWRAQLAAQQVVLDATDKKQQEIEKLLGKQQVVAETKYAAALKKYDLKVF
jgi:hypothetical protein